MPDGPCDNCEWFYNRIIARITSEGLQPNIELIEEIIEFMGMLRKTKVEKKIKEFSE